MRRLLPICLLLLLCLELVTIHPAAQVAAPAIGVIGSITVDGATRLSRDQVIALSALSVEQPVTVAQMNAAMDRLADTGLFSEVQYAYAIEGGRVRMTIQASEQKWTMPVVVDNFVWFSPAEIRSAIAREIPTFDGAIPVTAGATASVVRALETLLRSKNLTAQVTQSLATRQDGTNQRLRFFHDLPLHVCAVTFDGIGAEAQPDVSAAVDFLLARPFSSDALASALAGNALPALRQRGMVKAALAEPVVTMNSSPACPGGVTVAVAVRDATVYTWAGAIWTGNTVESTGSLNRALGMRTGAPADETRLAAGLSAVHEVYLKAGHLDVAVRREQNFDGTRVTDRFTVDEGARYTMGAFRTDGMSDVDGKRLASLWALKAGAAFDGTAVREFLRRVASTYKFPAGRRLFADPRPDRASRVVDVIVTIK